MKSVNNIKLSPRTIEQASLWFARLWADDATEHDIQQCQLWRQAHSEHERAWQHIAGLEQRFLGVPNRQAASQVLTKRPVNATRRQVLAVSGLGALGVLTLRYQQPSHSSGELLASAVGEQRELLLTGGTRLVLNTDTQVSIEKLEHYSRITLHQGEMFIQSGDKQHPVQVLSRQRVMQPIGTEYSVRAYAQHSALSVYDGMVKLKPPAEENTQGSIVSAGETVTFDQMVTGALSALPHSSAHWLDGKLAVSHMPLPEFINEIARYRKGWVQVDSNLEHLEVTGVFSLHDTQQILHQLAEILPVKLRTFSRYWVRVVAA